MSTNHEYVEVFARDLTAASNDERMFREPKNQARRKCWNWWSG
ncbi:MAG: hypothetical protein U1F42_06960 [Candidatus Competibacteraceae bacterium]